jgi:uncharacterized lipoprotein YmbA
MIMSRRRLGLGLCAVAALPAGCASPTPVLYTLDTEPGDVLGRGPKIVVLQDVSLTPYLDRQQIVRSSSNFHIDVESNNWWGESFSAMIGRVLAAGIDQRLPGTSVFGESGAVNVTADATVAVNITRFDLDDRGAVILTGQVGVTFATGRRPDISSGQRFSVPSSTPGIIGQVMAMSTALGELTDAIALILATRYR